MDRCGKWYRLYPFKRQGPWENWRDLPTAEECEEWIRDRKFTDGRLKQQWRQMGCLDRALRWIEDMHRIHGRNTKTREWIWKLAEEEFPPPTSQLQEVENLVTTRERVEEMQAALTSSGDIPDLPTFAKVRVRKREQQMTVAEQMTWVNNHLHCDRGDLMAPCKGAAAMWEHYSQEDNRHKFYQLLAQKVIPTETAEDEMKSRRRLEAEKAKLEEELAKMTAEQRERERKRKKEAKPQSDLAKDLGKMLERAAES